MKVVIFKPARSAVFIAEYNGKKVDGNCALCIRLVNVPDADKDPSFYMLCTFEQYEKASQKTIRTSFHMTINPTADELEDTEKILDYIDDVMSRLGYGWQPYVVFAHRDTGRLHFHVVSVRVDANGHGLMVFDEVQGKEILASRHEHRRCYRICHELEAKYGFAIDGVATAPEEQLEYEVFDRRKGNIWCQYDAIATNVIEQYEVASFEQFRDVMLTRNIEVTEYMHTVKDKKTGERREMQRLVCAVYNAKGQSRAKHHFIPLYLQRKLVQRMSSVKIPESYCDAVCEYAKVSIFESASLDAYRKMLRDYHLTAFLNTEDDELVSVTIVDDAAKRAVDITDALFFDRLRELQSGIHAARRMTISDKSALDNAKKRLSQVQGQMPTFTQNDTSIELPSSAKPVTQNSKRKLSKGPRL